MNTELLLQIIGPEVANVIVTGRYGDASLHANGYVVGDPCYLEVGKAATIRDAMRAAYPWASYDYNAARKDWRPFQLNGQTCYCRDTGGDGVFFNHCVDSGGLVAVLLTELPKEIQEKFMEVPSVSI